MNIFEFLKYLFDKNLPIGLLVSGGFCLTLVFILGIIGDVIIHTTKK